MRLISRCAPVRQETRARVDARCRTEPSGDVVASIHGEATFQSRRPGPGGTAIIGHWSGYDHIRARVVLGPRERPLAELRARAGKLALDSASDTRIAGG